MWHDDPIEAIQAWYADARASEPDVPDAFQLATVNPSGLPAVRTVLMKDLTSAGLVFYTNLHSRKGRDLAAHPYAAATFHWKSLQRQVHLAGPVVPVSDAEADAYFASRPRGSQIGAWASPQSEELPDRATLDAAVAAVAARFDGRPVPRPPHWTGLRIVPLTIELWQGRADRLHDRRASARADPSAPWRTVRLAP